jgi:hypothetical protein
MNNYDDRDDCDTLRTLSELQEFVHVTSVHIDASKCPSWMGNSLLRLEKQGKVIRREVTIHYPGGGSVNYIGFFLK